jgi:uracil-DNA glycosylase family 4
VKINDQKKLPTTEPEEKRTERKPRKTSEPDTSLEALAACRKCRKLSHQFKKLRVSHPDYWNKPVPASGNSTSKLLIVGLAPGMHGANRTGVPFKGDASGNLLFKTLEATELVDKVSITNAVKCLPIKNLPTGKEIGNCNHFLKAELICQREKGGVVLALGGVSHRAVIRALGLKQADYPFGHAAVHRLDAFDLVDTYHCSRYNTQTGRLTEAMFLDVLQTAGNMAYP